MGEVSVSAAAFAGRLERAVKEGLAAVGIKAVTHTEKVPGTKLLRLIVMAAGFEHLGPTERQNLVWRIIETHIPRAEQMRISLVLTVSKREAGANLRAELSGRN